MNSTQPINTQQDEVPHLESFLNNVNPETDEIGRVTLDSAAVRDLIQNHDFLDSYLLP
jgi:hypothetical protein